MCIDKLRNFDVQLLVLHVHNYLSLFCTSCTFSFASLISRIGSVFVVSEKSHLMYLKRQEFK